MGFKKSRLVFVLIPWMALSVCAGNVASALFGGTKGVVEIMEKLGGRYGLTPSLWSHFSWRRRAERRTNRFIMDMVTHNRDRVLEVFGLPPDTSGERFLRGSAFWDVASEDADLLSKVVTFLNRDIDELDDGIESVEEFLKNMSDLATLAYRAGSSGRRERFFFVYPVFYSYTTERFAEFIMLQPLNNTAIRDIAMSLPRDRPDLVAMAKERLVDLGFDEPTDRQLYAVSSERIAVWMLLAHIYLRGEKDMRVLADAVFCAMRSGSRDFFGSANDNMAYRLFFKWDTFDKAKITGLIESLSAIADLREANQNMTMTEAIRFVRMGAAPFVR